jgi:hypothetical protein
MTIALGFPYDRGIILASDTRFTIGSVKMDGMKMGCLQFDKTLVSAVFAGNVDFASAAFQRFERSIISAPASHPALTIAKELDEFCKHHVYSHPEYADHEHDFFHAICYKPQRQPSRVICNRGNHYS